MSWIRIGRGIFNPSKVKSITLQDASIVVSYDTNDAGETEIKFDSHDIAKELFESMAMEWMRIH